MSLSVKLSSSGVMSMRPELSAWIGRGGGGWVKVNASSCGELGQEPSRVRVMYGRKKGAWSNIGKGELEHSQQRERSPGGRGEKHVHTPYLAKRDLQRGIKRELMTTRWEHAPPPPPRAFSRVRCSRKSALIMCSPESDAPDKRDREARKVL